MRLAATISTFLLPLLLTSTFASPLVGIASGSNIEIAKRAQPPPCLPNPKITCAQTEQRATEFAQAFIYKKDIDCAFTYISKDYINHNPQAKNGSASAYHILSPWWNSQKLTPLRTAFKSPQSWLEYISGTHGYVVDRYRWDGGCIVEHWDQGESFPA